MHHRVGRLYVWVYMYVHVVTQFWDQVDLTLKLCNKSDIV